MAALRMRQQLTSTLKIALKISMGIEELWKHYIPGVKAKPAEKFNTAKNSRIAVDISCLLHACISKPKIALQTCCGPSYVPNDVITVLESNHKSLVKHKTHPYYIFDGCDHPMKAFRVAERNKAKTALHVFYERGKDPDEVLTDDDCNSAMKNMRTMTSRTNELINLVKKWMIENSTDCMCAPFEAEWQCACLEQNDAVDGATSIDGDFMVLSVRKSCFSVNFNTEKFQVCDKSIDITKVHENPLFRNESSKWLLIASLLGNDHAKRILNVGHTTTFNKKLPQLVAWDAQNTMKACNNSLRSKMSQ